MTQDLSKLQKAIETAKKAEAEIDALCAQADKAVKDAESALKQTKEAKRKLYESVGRKVQKGRPAGSKNKAKKEESKQEEGKEEKPE